METYKRFNRSRRQKRLVVLLATLIMASTGYAIYYQWFKEWSGKLEEPTATYHHSSRKTFFVRTDKGFDQTQPVEVEIPFEISRLEWRSKGRTTFIYITLSSAIPLQVKQHSAYDFQIWLNNYEQVVWLGHHLCPQEVDKVVHQPLVLDGINHQVISQGQIAEEGNRILITLPIATREVKAVQLYYIPSQEMLRQAGGVPVMVSSLVHQRPPWGYRIRRLPVKWCDECTYETH